jgi:lysozyme family protein
MTENFLKAYNEVMSSEGLYSNHPADKGGET